MTSDNNNNEVIHCPEDDEFTVYCDICDNLCIERFCKKHLKSQTHTDNFRKREQVNK